MNTHYDYPDVWTATVKPLSEGELAADLEREGVKVAVSSDRYWARSRLGLWGGTHWLARFSIDQISPPRFPRWGYRVALAEPDLSHANASIPAYVVTDPAAYDERQLSPRMARYVKAFRKQDVQLVRLTDSRVIKDQGYEVLVSWSHRTMGSEARIPDKDAYLDRMRRRIESPHWLVFAGMRGDNLLGYMTSWSVDGSGYLHDLHMRTDSMTVRLGPALYFETIRILGASGLVREVCCGIDRPETRNLLQHKARMGFATVPIPSRLWLNPAARAIIQRLTPHKYYRLTGETAAM